MVIFVAGLSGAGKTVAASESGVETTLSLDSFFLDEQPGLPKWLGRTDWETIRSFDLEAAVATTISLALGRRGQVPIYNHQFNSSAGSTEVIPSGPVVAEGVYAPDVYDRVRSEGVNAILLLLEASAAAAFRARVRRDVIERHMNPIWAILRSARLFLRHGQYRRDTVARGAERVDRAAAPPRIAELARSPGAA